MKGNGEVILERKVSTEELEKFLEKIENKTIVLEPTKIAIGFARKLRKNIKSSLPTHKRLSL